MADGNSAGAQLARRGLAPKKQFGQNFLINPGICEKIAELAVPQADFGVLEIGPGMGALTRALAARARRVVAVEIDTDLVPVLRENLADCRNLHIVQADILKTDVAALIREQFAGMRVAVAGNLP